MMNETAADTGKRRRYAPERGKAGIVLSGWLLVILWGLPLAGCRDGGGLESPAKDGRTIRISYPDSYRDTLQVDTYHGEKIADPYHWLEYDNTKSVKKWINDQRKLTDN